MTLITLYFVFLSLFSNPVSSKGLNAQRYNVCLMNEWTILPQLAIIPMKWEKFVIPSFDSEGLENWKANSKVKPELRPPDRRLAFLPYHTLSSYHKLFNFYQFLIPFLKMYCLMFKKILIQSHSFFPSLKSWIFLSPQVWISSPNYLKYGLKEHFPYWNSNRNCICRPCSKIEACDF